MRKITLFVALCGTMMASAAHAQSADAQAWTGCSVGGEVGAAWNSTRVTDEVSSYEIGSLSDASIAGGVRLGCDYQVAGPLVIGVLGDFNWTGLKKSATSIYIDPLVLTGKVSRVATVTARAGYLLTPGTLGYAKAGVAWTRTSALLTYDGSAVDSVGFSQSGFTAGAGVEHRIRRNLSVFAEYNYYGAGDKTVFFPNSDNTGVVHQNNQSLLIGVNFRFWGK